jgi:hypothetical protein
MLLFVTSVLEIASKCFLERLKAHHEYYRHYHHRRHGCHSIMHSNTFSHFESDWLVK